MGIGERKRRRLPPRFRFTNGNAVLRQPIGPVAETVEGRGQRDLRGEADSRLGGRHLGPREKRYVGAGMASPIGVEEVIGSGRILIDALLHHPHAENAGVEVDVFLSIARDTGDVVESRYAGHVERPI